MTTLSVCMIVKNEEALLGRCLDCVKTFADEIIVVDTGSSDQTKTIAARYCAKVYDFEWIDDFSAARNFSFSKATKAYIMWIDADDVIDLENQKRIIDLKKTMDTSIDLVMMRYDVAFDENGDSTDYYYRERFLKRTLNYKWVGEIHEVIVPSGNIAYVSISIFHKKCHPNEPRRNLKIFEQMISRNKVLEPRQQYYYARELYYNNEFDAAIKQYNAFLNEGNGWIENNIGACKELAACYTAISDDQSALLTLFKSFLYSNPRAEICCDIGALFLKKACYEQAIFWYKVASNLDLNEQIDGFVRKDCYNFIPYMQICLCYDKLGLYEQAKQFNEKAGIFNANHQSYLFNKSYFENKIKKIIKKNN